MKAFFEPRNLYAVLKPLFAWTKLFGLTPFALTNDTCNTSTLSLGVSVAAMIIFGILSANIIYLKEDDGSDGLITNITEILELYITNVNMLVAILFGCVSRHKIIKVIHSINKIDIELKAMLIAVDLNALYKTTAIRLIVAVISINIYFLLLILCDVHLFWDKNNFYTAMITCSYILPKMITTFNVTQFCVLNLLVSQRFRMINERLVFFAKFMLSCNDSGRSYLFLENMDKRSSSTHPIVPRIFFKEKCVETVDRMRFKHFELCDIGKALNNAYSVQLLSSTLQIFVTLLACLFYCIKHVISENLQDVSGKYLIPYTVNIAVLSLSQIVAISFVCSKTTSEAKKTGCIIHKTVPVTFDKELEIEMLYFSIQLLHQNVEFTACQMFKLDESLILSMIGVICTYLVIVIQFEFGTKGKE